MREHCCGQAHEPSQIGVCDDCPDVCQHQYAVLDPREGEQDYAAEMIHMRCPHCGKALPT